MSTQWLFIEAQDVWMFRDNKPFNAQQNFVARSQFPPNPQTMQGAIRTLFMEQSQVDWNAFKIGGASDVVYQVVGRGTSKGRAGVSGSLALAGPFVAEEVDGAIQRLFPAPFDLVAQTDAANLAKPPKDRVSTFDALRPANIPDLKTDAPFAGWKPLALPGDGWAEAMGWLDEVQFAAYLKGEPFVGQIRRKVTVDDDRMGLGLDDGRRANEQGMLYRARFVRPHGEIGLMVAVTGADLPAKGIIRLGGESRTANFRTVEYTPGATPIESTRYKVVLLTPAYFMGGDRPDDTTGDGDWSPWVGDGKLVSATIGKPLAISGWNMAHNRPRPLRHYVPAGSVFFFEGGKWNGKPFTETPHDVADFGAMGFGSVAIGTWEYPTQEQTQ